MHGAYLCAEASPLWIFNILHTSFSTSMMCCARTYRLQWCVAHVHIDFNDVLRTYIYSTLKSSCTYAPCMEMRFLCVFPTSVPQVATQYGQRRTPIGPPEMASSVIKWHSWSLLMLWWVRTYVICSWLVGPISLSMQLYNYVGQGQGRRQGRCFGCLSTPLTLYGIKALLKDPVELSTPDL